MCTYAYASRCHDPMTLSHNPVLILAADILGAHAALIAPTPRGSCAQHLYFESIDYPQGSKSASWLC